MNDKKIIFVSYYPGCCGQFIGALCEILLGLTEVGGIQVNNIINTMIISNTGEIIRTVVPATQEVTSMIYSKFGNDISCRVKFNEKQTVLFREFLHNDFKKILETHNQKTHVLTSHLLCMHELENQFNEQKKILIVPTNEQEIKLARSLWSHKRQQHNNDDESFEDSNLKSLLDYHSDNVLKLNIFDILNSDNIDNIVTAMIDHLGVTNKNKELAINFYRNYLKKQNYNIILSHNPKIL